MPTGFGQQLFFAHPNCAGRVLSGRDRGGGGATDKTATADCGTERLRGGRGGPPAFARSAKEAHSAAAARGAGEAAHPVAR